MSLFLCLCLSFFRACDKVERNHTGNACICLLCSLGVCGDSLWESWVRPLGLRSDGGCYPQGGGFSACLVVCLSLLESFRVISTARLRPLPTLHLQPINVVVFNGTYLINNGKTHLEGGFTLRCFQRLSRPYIATLQCNWRYNRYTRGTSIPVLSY